MTRAEGQVLLCRARARLCAVPLNALVETLRPLPITSLAGAPAFVVGVAVVRGRSVPVVDLGALLGDPAPAVASRFLMLRVGERHVALAVEAVLGVRRLEPTGLGALPPLLRDCAEGAVAAIGSLDAELLVALETTRLVPEAFGIERGTAP